jgi:hypothetical protein
MVRGNDSLESILGSLKKFYKLFYYDIYNTVSAAKNQLPSGENTYMVAARNLPKVVFHSEAMRQVSYFFPKKQCL